MTRPMPLLVCLGKTVGSIRAALNPAARKLTLARALRRALIATSASAAVWGFVVLLIGRSEVLFFVVAVFAVGALLAAILSSRSTLLDAARHVEQLAGWKEKLSTAVELEAAQTGSVFYDRLRDEAEGLIRQSSPVGLIPWDVQRPAVVAAVLVLVAVVVTALFPDGAVGLLTGAGEAARKDRAAEVLARAAERLAAASPDAPGIDEMRLELVRLLNDVRRRRDIDETRRSTRLLLAEIDDRSDNRPVFKAEQIARELERASSLRPVAAALRRTDAANITRESVKAARRVPGMDEDERRSAADALSAAAEASDLPGLSDALRAAAAALGRPEAAAFERAMREFADALVRETGRADAEREALDEVRTALERVQSVLSGKGDPGEEPRRSTADFFVEGKTSLEGAGGSANLVVHGKADDIRRIWESSKTSDMPVPGLSDIIGEQAVRERDTIDPTYREYVRRYFAVEEGNR